MLKNYFRIAIRNLMKNKAFSLINICGLGLGMACSLFIYLWVQDERNQDNFHKQGDQLYKVIVHHVEKDGSISGSMAVTPGRLAETLKKEIPEVAGATALVGGLRPLFATGLRSGKENGLIASADFFSMFSFPLLRGNPATILAAPDNIVISQKLARNYFGKEDPVGKTIRINDKRDYQVSGIMADVPRSSSMQFDFMLPAQHTFEDFPWMVDGWDNYGVLTYVLLRKDASPEKVNAKIRDFLFRHDKEINDKALSLQLFRDAYLYSSFTNGVATGGKIGYIRLFSIAAIFILLIACINFMNLATARSVKRAKEVGVRKAVGADKGLLFGQFMAEAVMTALLALVLAVLLVVLLMPVFNEFTGKDLYFRLYDPYFIFVLLGLTLVTGFIAGSYPALFLSSLNAITVLKGGLKFKPGATLFRKGLVVFQFVLSIILIVGTMIVYRQVQFIQTKNLGLDRENIIYVPLEGSLGANFETFKNTLLQSGHIADVSRASATPTNVGMATDAAEWPGKDPAQKTGFGQMAVGYNFIHTMQIRLKEGRDFSPAYGTDSANFLVNETAVKTMRLKAPVGTPLTFNGKKGKIIGVMQDFHFHSLHEYIAPIVINFLDASQFSNAIIKTKAGSTKAALAALERTCKQMNPKYPFAYQFADDSFKQQYESEIMIGQLADVFAFLAIFISCMGLFGLALFVAEQRTKEIGIRKVLGATFSNIVAMLSKDFLALVLVAALIAFPFAGWLMHSWLQRFAYQVNINWPLLFVLAGGCVLLVALLTVSIQAIKAAIANPVKALRAE